MPSALVFLGKLGAALADLDASIAAFEKSGNPSAARFHRVYRGTVLFYAMDFEGTLQDCGPAALRPLESALAALWIAFAHNLAPSRIVRLSGIRRMRRSRLSKPSRTESIEDGVCGSIVSNGSETALIGSICETSVDQIGIERPVVDARLALLGDLGGAYVSALIEELT